MGGDSTMERYNITYDEIYEFVKSSCTTVSPDCLYLLNDYKNKETNTAARELLQSMIDNVAQANQLDKPVCQSPGYPTIYIRFGDNFFPPQLLNFLTDALVSATKQGYLRPSIVDSLSRNNPGDNSGDGVPNFELQYRPGQEYLEVIISFKGCGAELGNVMKIMTPAQMGNNLSGFERLVYATVAEAGGIPCPPIALGIGIGGQMDVACKLSREAISTRHWLDENPDPRLNELEKRLLEGINSLGIGPAGTGGRTTCLAVKIGMKATHTAIFPVAINFHCWVARRKGVRIYADGRREYLFNGGLGNE
jgi:fumarate hydratase subunit alpha